MDVARDVSETAIVTGASRGFGRAIAEALTKAGIGVVGVARTRADLDEVHELLGDGFTAVSADAADPDVAARLIDEHRPRIIVLCAGAAPSMRPLQDHDWESFSRNWNVDVAQTFHWASRALRTPLRAGSSLIAISSGAAIKGSPLSGGYAGANATVKFITDYAALESDRARLGIDFVSILPQLTPATDLGAAAVAAYAERQGVDLATFLGTLVPALTPQQVGQAVVEIATVRREEHRSYGLGAAGLVPLGQSTAPAGAPRT